jgi:hypothetical protein
MPNLLPIFCGAQFTHFREEERGKNEGKWCGIIGGQMGQKIVCQFRSLSTMEAAASSSTQTNSLWAPNAPTAAQQSVGTEFTKLQKSEEGELGTLAPIFTIDSFNTKSK